MREVSHELVVSEVKQVLFYHFYGEPCHKRGEQIINGYCVIKSPEQSDVQSADGYSQVIVSSPAMSITDDYRDIFLALKFRRDNPRQQTIIGIDRHSV